MVAEKTIKQTHPHATEVPLQTRRRVWPWVIGLPLWTYGGFLAAQLIAAAMLWVLVVTGVPIQSVHTTLLTTVVAAVSYSIALAVVIGLPWLVYRRRTTRSELGVSGRPEWLDVVLPLIVFAAYMVATTIVMIIATSLLPIDVGQKQALPFEQTAIMPSWERLLIFFTLVIAAPVAEELLFRGYLHGKLRAIVPIWAAVLLTAVAFGLAHAWGGPGHPLQWAVVVDTIVLGLFLSGLREYTGAIWAGIGLHMIKNGLAFYFIFVNPDIIQQLKSAAVALL